ncbi:MAG: hypothetical protein ABI821_17520 [Pseudomonadota bacterium]
MKNTAFSTAFLVALFALFAALPAHAIKGRPTAISFVDPYSEREIYAFVKGDNGNRLRLAWFSRLRA